MPNRSDTADLVPVDAPADAAYERDYYSWALEQARLLREGRLDAIDRENLAEEIEDLGREQFHKLERALRVLMMHMLKWDHQPERRTRSWTLSIAAQRIRLERVLKENPDLKSRLGEAIDEGYRLARIEAAQETDLPLKTFPDTCLYDWAAITQREFAL